MVYSGGFFDANNANYMNFVDSFAGSNASIGLVIGSLAALQYPASEMIPVKVPVFALTLP